MKRTLFVCLLLSIWTIPAFAWHTNTHLQMTRDALSLMPADFQKIFTEHIQYTESGIKDPDELIKDWSNHYYIPAIPEGGALDRIDKLVAIIQAKFKAKNTYDAARQLCYLAHYIGDLWTPEAQIKRNTATDEYFVKNNSIVVSFDGYTTPVQDIHDYLKKRSEWRWKLENSDKINTLLYSEAVNDIARVWLTIWQQNGNQINAISQAVLEHQASALNINFERLNEDLKYHTAERESMSQSATEAAQEMKNAANKERGDEYWANMRGTPHYYSAYSESAVANATAAANSNLQDTYESGQREQERIKGNITPSTGELAAAVEARNQQAMMSSMAPDAQFKMLETSLRTIGDKGFFVARLRNQSKETIPSIAFMYPGVRGALALVKDLQPGQVSKIEAVLPANASKDQMQVIYSATNQQ